MPENLGSAELTLRAVKASQFKRDMKSAEQSVGGLRGQLDKAQGGLKGLASGFTSMVNPATLAIGAVTGIGAALLKVGTDSQNATRTIANATGATGESLKALRSQFDRTFSSVPDQMGVVANAFSSLQTLTGATGETLGSLTESVLDASRALGEDAAANAGKFGTALMQFQEPAKLGTLRMDEMFVASQKFDVGIGQLLGSLNEYGSVLSNAGFTMSESTELFGRLAAAGISVSRVMPGLNKFFRDNAEAGRDSQQELARVVDAMKSAESQTEALSIATKAFGAEGAQRMTTAVRTGAFAVEDLGKALDGAAGSVAKATEENKTLGEAFGELTNKTTILIEPLAKGLVDALTDVVETMDAAADSSVSFGAKISAARVFVDQYSAVLSILAPQLKEIVRALDFANQLFGDQEQVFRDTTAEYQNLVRDSEAYLQSLTKVTDEIERNTGAASRNEQSLAGMLQAMNDNRIHELTTKIEEQQRALKDLAAAAPDVAVGIKTIGIEAGAAKNPADDLAGALESMAKASEAARDDAVKLGKNVGAQREPLLQVSTIVTDLSGALADVVLESRNWSDALLAVGKSILRHIIESGLKEYLNDILGMIPGLGKLFSGLGGSGGVPGVSGGGGGGFSGGGLGGLITGGVTAASSVFGNFQAAETNATLKEIGHWTKLTAISIGGETATGTGGLGLRDTLFVVAERLDFIVASTDDMKSTLWDIRALLGGMSTFVSTGVRDAAPSVGAAVGDAISGGLGPRSRGGFRGGTPSLPGLTFASNTNIGMGGRPSPRSRGGSRAPFSQTGGTGLLGGFSGGPFGRRPAATTAPPTGPRGALFDRMTELQAFAAANAGSAARFGGVGSGPGMLLAPLMSIDSKADSLMDVVGLLGKIAAKETVVNVKVLLDSKEISSTVISEIGDQALLAAGAPSF